MRRTLRSGALVLLMLAACDSSGGSSTSAPAKGSSAAVAPKDVVATVNGASLTRLDVMLRVKADSHSKSTLTPERAKAVIETLVKQELAAQKAAELGLDADPKYQEGLRALQAQVDAYRRKELAEAYFRSEVEKKSPVTDAEAKKFFDDNAARLRVQLHVNQLLVRSEATITLAAAQLENGKSFDEVARSSFPAIAPDQKPWDLGFLAWHKIPQQWRSVVYDLPPGKPSGIIRGPNERFWIVQVVERREDPNVDFEAMKEAIKTDLKVAKAEQLRDKAEAALLETAKVSYNTTPFPAPDAEE